MTPITTEAALALASVCTCRTTPECAHKWLAECGQMLEALVADRDSLQAIATRYHWLCSHLTQIHVETSQPAGSPADSPMRVTLIQAWPNLPRTEPESADEAVAAAMKEMP